MRGNRLRERVKLDFKRSIPACAGEPPLYAITHPPIWVYPRVCGGTQSLFDVDSDTEGLSPRVRGNPVPPDSPTREEGSIPACAGEPDVLVHPRARIEVYPRVCGGTKSPWS